jgi:organic hydroperoxide reductase OsmC/OhrA
VAVSVKRFDYAIELDRGGRISAEGGAALELGRDWSAEHLVLAGLTRCSLTSLRYHAKRCGIDVTASGSASGVVAKREQDGRYAFVEIECRLEVELEPAPPGEELTALIEKAERDCFVGASLTVQPRYRWRVNGEDAS